MIYPKPIDFLLIILLGMIFGSSFVFIKTSVASIPPLMLVGLRVFFGAIFLNILLKITDKHSVNYLKRWKDYILQGLVGYTIPFFLISYGARELDSSYVAIMMASLPIITGVIAHCFTADEKLSSNKILGILVGFVGVVMIILQGNSIANENSVLPCLMVLGGCGFFAISTITGRRFKNDPPLVTATGALTCATIYLIPITLGIYLFEQPIITLTSLSAVASLGVICTGLAYYVFFWLLARIGATWTSIHDYLVPIFGSLFGIYIYGEQINIYEFIGALIVIFGILVMYLKLNWLKKTVP